MENLILKEVFCGCDFEDDLLMLKEIENALIYPEKDDAKTLSLIGSIMSIKEDLFHLKVLSDHVVA